MFGEIIDDRLNSVHKASNKGTHAEVTLDEANWYYKELLGKMRGGKNDKEC